MSAICPKCGFDLIADEVIDRDGIVFDPRGDVIWHGDPVHFTRTERMVLYALLKAGGRFLSEEALRERTDYQGDHNTIEVMIFRIRAKLGRDTISSLRGLGWRWSPTADGSGRVLAGGGLGGSHASVDRTVSEVMQ